MAFINKDGMRISFDAEELIEELEADIWERGTSFPVLVVMEIQHGVEIYKDYNLDDGSGNIGFQLKDGEHVVKMTAGELLRLYVAENYIL